MQVEKVVDKTESVQPIKPAEQKPIVTQPTVKLASTQSPINVVGDKPAVPPPEPAKAQAEKSVTQNAKPAETAKENLLEKESTNLLPVVEEPQM